MTLLRDPHALLWWPADDDQLERQARELIEDPDRPRFFEGQRVPNVTAEQTAPTAGFTAR